MNGRRALRQLPRASTLHLVQSTQGIGWSALAMTGDALDDLRLVIGPSRIRVCARATTLGISGVLTAPLGIERLLTRRLRAWIMRRGTCPARVVSYGSAAGELAAASLNDVDRIVHTDSPVDARIHCARSAVEFARGAGSSAGEVSRKHLREQLGIRAQSSVILAGGDDAPRIDTRRAFTIISQVVLAGGDAVLVASTRARWARETRTFAERVGMSDRLILIDAVEIPSALWRAADAMLLLAPADPQSNRSWWGWCAWWSLASGLPLIHESCADDGEGSVSFDLGDSSGAVRALLALIEQPGLCEELSEGAIRSAASASRGEILFPAPTGLVAATPVSA